MTASRDRNRPDDVKYIKSSFLFKENLGEHIHLSPYSIQTVDTENAIPLKPFQNLADFSHGRILTKIKNPRNQFQNGIRRKRTDDLHYTSRANSPKLKMNPFAEHFGITYLIHRKTVLVRGGFVNLKRFAFKKRVLRGATLYSTKKRFSSSVVSLPLKTFLAKSAS